MAETVAKPGRSGVPKRRSINSSRTPSCNRRDFPERQLRPTAENLKGTRAERRVHSGNRSRDRVQPLAPPGPFHDVHRQDHHEAWAFDHAAPRQRIERSRQRSDSVRHRAFVSFARKSPRPRVSELPGGSLRKPAALQSAAHAQLRRTCGASTIATIAPSRIAMIHTSTG